MHPERKAFVAAGGNFWVYVHDFETGEELQCNKGHHGPVYGVRFTPGGNTYASGGDDGTIRIWTYANGAEAGGDAAADDDSKTSEKDGGGYAPPVKTYEERLAANFFDSVRRDQKG